jgi:hypothetical protein
VPPQNTRARLRRDVDPADPITTRLMQSLQLAAWGKQHSPDKDEAIAFERQCFDYLLHWLGELERHLPSFDLPCERKERRNASSLKGAR